LLLLSFLFENHTYIKRRGGASMEEIIVVIRNLQHDNKTLCEFIVHLQNSPSLDIIHVCFHITNLNKGIMNNLHDKFDKTHYSKF
jgi:hypothetical protein